MAIQSTVSNILLGCQSEQIEQKADVTAQEAKMGASRTMHACMRRSAALRTSLHHVGCANTVGIVPV